MFRSRFSASFPSRTDLDRDRTSDALSEVSRARVKCEPLCARILDRTRAAAGAASGGTGE